MRRPLLHGFLALMLLGARRTGATEIAPRIVNGVYTSLYPSTGALLDSGNFAIASLICSGTLIGCQTFLTAGHCVEGNLDPASYSVFLQHAGFFRVSSIALHPTFNFPVGDVAVLRLTTPVTGVAPTPINAASRPAFGTSGTIVGFGRSGGGFDYGLKRAGAVTTASCTGVSNTTSVCWHFSDPLGPPGSNSNTCNGDSGGPLFVATGGGPVVAGVTSGGDSPDCQPTDNSYDANVAFYASYIQAQGGADLANTACGGIPQAGNPGTTILAATGEVRATAPEGRHSFTVPVGTGLVRVSMNAVDDGSDFDLYVRAGSPPTTATYDCRQFGANQYAFCEFAAPAPGTWHVLVDRFAGGGIYQVTVTEFNADCAVPGSDGNACDDGNACTGSDTCQGGTCAGAPVVDGTPCDDGHICTFRDGCQAGACVGAVPSAGECKRPVESRRGLFQLKNDPFDDGRDRLVWRWASGAQTDKTEWGSPLASTSFGLCVYDESGGARQLIMERLLPAGAFWRERANGFKYVDANSGFRSVILKAGAAGRASIAVNGQGPGLAMVPLPLDQDDAVAVQLVTAGACWEARYSTHVINDAAQFKARDD